MNCEYKKVLKEGIMTYFRVLSQDCTTYTERNMNYLIYAVSNPDYAAQMIG
jgi:hypothetical protein